jgi:putative endonuclease
MHYVYVLRSVSDHGFYIGYSANLRRRFEQHVKGDSVATSHRGPWKLIYYEAYLDQHDALGREKYLKSGAGKISQSSASALPWKKSDQIRRQNSHDLEIPVGRSFMLDHVDKVFTWMIYTHVLNKPGIGVKSPLD